MIVIHIQHQVGKIDITKIKVVGHFISLAPFHNNVIIMMFYFYIAPHHTFINIITVEGNKQYG